MTDLSGLDLSGSAPISPRKPNPSIFVKDANLDIHVPTAGEAGDLEQSHTFRNVLSRYIEDVNTLQHDSDAQIQRYAAGETENIHEVMLAMDEAQTSFDLMMQIRNQLIENYRDLQRSS